MNRITFLSFLLLASLALAQVCLASEIVIYDDDVLRVGFGPGGKLAYVKHDRFMDHYSIEDETGRRLAFEWDNPILDAGFLPSGLCAYLMYDKFHQRLQVKTESGAVLWIFHDADLRPSRISFADNGDFFFAVKDAHLGWFRVVNRYGHPVHTTFHDRIHAFSIQAAEDLHLVMDGFADRLELRKPQGQLLHRFDRDEQVLSVHVRGGVARYLARDTFFDRLVIRSVDLPGREARRLRQEGRFRALHGE